MIGTVKSRERRVKSRNRYSALRSASSSRLSTLDSRPPHSGFTLIELLIVITILAILATLVVGIATVAGETGRDAKTRNMIARIHTLLMEHYNSYKTRRIELNPAVIDAINTSGFTSAERGRVTAAARLYALREMMLMEIPDRWSDVLLLSVPAMPTGVGDARPPLYLAQRTALSQNYLRRYNGLVGRSNSRTGSINTDVEIKRNQGAECLYLTIMLACGDGESRSLFSESDVGDTDGDGALEFLDGWGNPINFLRWAPGFYSGAQLSSTRLAEIGAAAVAEGKNASQEVAKAITSDHDPFDLFRVQPGAFRLVPLIYSPGPDEDSGLQSNVDYVPWGPPSAAVMPSSATFPYFDYRLDPFVASPDFLGSDNGQGTATDNIHNHLIGRRL